MITFILSDKGKLLKGKLMVTLTNRLHVRPVIESDLESLFKIYGNPATNTFNPRGPHIDIAHSREVLCKWLDHWQINGFGNCAISLLDQNEIIIGFGGLSIVNFNEVRTTNLGYRLSSEYWGRGLATEFSICALKHGFGSINLTEISAVVRKNHYASQKVLLKSGLKYIREISDIKDEEPSLLYSQKKKDWIIGYI